MVDEAKQLEDAADVVASENTEKDDSHNLAGAQRKHECDSDTNDSKPLGQMKLNSFRVALAAR